ncbi:hypothetical protein FACS1894122_09460 [Alphaproteobacteria bacterium]|nr:hypothetical protein FACS1894122_09460 [Alphaproteobacteria bacterium]
MKKLICSACVMIMMSLTPFEVQGAIVSDAMYVNALGDIDQDDGNPNNLDNGAAANAWNFITQDGERNVDGNIDTIFGRYARWRDLANGDSHIVFMDLDSNESLDPNVSEYDEGKHAFIGKAVWDAARAVNEANTAYAHKKFGGNGGYGALVQKVPGMLREIKWTKEQWSNMLSENDIFHPDFGGDRNAAVEWWYNEANNNLNELIKRYETAAKACKDIEVAAAAAARGSVTAGPSINSVARLCGKKGGMKHVNPPEEAPLFARVERLAEGKEVVDYPLVLPAPPAAPPLPAPAIAGAAPAIAAPGAVPPPPLLP